MNFIKLTLFFVFLFAFRSVSIGQLHAETPRFLVGIYIEGLQQKHIEMLWPYFEPGGFKRLFGEGATFKNLSFNTLSAGTASDVASVLTGSIPFYHGITGKRYFDKQTQTTPLFVHDDQEIGIGTTESYSAYNLLTSTFIDVLKLAYPNRSKVYAVGLHPTETILMGGHTANSVAWIDDVQLKWVTTGYYKEGLSRAADKMNISGQFKTTASQVWKPLYSPNTYISSISDHRKSNFSITPDDKRNKQTQQTWLTQTPAANTLVVDLGLQILTDENLGTDNIPDALMLQLTVRTPNDKTFSLQSIEKEDMYLRLDKELQKLLQKVDQKIGIDKTLFFVYTNQTEAFSPTELGENSIPAGYFNATRSMALLNTYLMALYGQERWVLGYYGKQIYLNKPKAVEKKINFSELQQAVVDFMPKFEGIQTVKSSQHLMADAGGDTNQAYMRMRNSIHVKTMGDVVISLMPGWLEVDDQYRFLSESNSIVSYMPLIFYGWNIKSEQINTSYRITDIAPTICRLLNLPMPNATIGKPIIELIE